MNAPHPALTPDTLASLRQAANAAGQAVMLRLQEQFGLDADATLHLLAAHCRLPAFDMAALNALAVDFGKLGFNEAGRRHCLVAHDAEEQLWLLLFEQFQHPNGQVPAYEWEFSDLNPPVHAWAVWRVYNMDRLQTGRADRHFLERCFHKLLMNFTWWVNRVDADEGGR